MNSIYKDVGLKIRARRRQLGMTIEDLAEATGLHPSYVGQIERDVKKASLLTLELVAAALGIRIGVLFGRAGPLAAVTGSEKIASLMRANTAAERKIIVGTLRRLSKSLKTLR